MSETTTASKSSRLPRPYSPGSVPRVSYDVDPPRRRRAGSGDQIYPVTSRRNSMSLQDAKSVLQNTTHSVLAPTDTENPTWHTIPLAFAVLPAIGGVLFTGGTYFVTDVMLLFLVAVFLHWLVKFPWEWYHSSQTISPSPSSTLDPTPSPTRTAASRELRRNEHLALLSCFIGPLLGGWLLHTIRTQLSRPSEGLVSNFNLTIYVLAAELRPIAQVVKLIRERSLYLQSVIHHPPITRVEVLYLRVEELQEQVKELTGLTAKAIERDPDLDALNRTTPPSGLLGGEADFVGAVRRYEKKEAIHSAHTETRILEIDSRLNDVITLAAAAAARREETTFSMLLLEWTCAVIVIPFTLTWRLLSLPAKAVETVAGLRRGQLMLRGVERRGKGRGGRGKGK